MDSPDFREQRFDKGRRDHVVYSALPFFESPAPLRLGLEGCQLWMAVDISVAEKGTGLRELLTEGWPRDVREGERQFVEIRVHECRHVASGPTEYVQRPQFIEEGRSVAFVILSDAD